MAQKKKVDYQRHISFPQALNELRKKDERIAVLEWEVNNEWTFNIQQSMDCAVIALHQQFGFGPDRCQKFLEAFRENLVLWMQMSLKEVRETEQGKGNEDFWFTQGKMDEAVRAALGDAVPSWEERYSEDRLLAMLADLRRIKTYVRGDMK